MKQAKKASPTPAPAAPAATLPSSLAALNGRVAEINARHKIVTAEILRLEQAGVKVLTDKKVPFSLEDVFISLIESRRSEIPL